MKDRKFNKHNRDKRINTIIEIRSEILTMLRDLGKDLDNGLYASNQRDEIRQEIKEIAQMVRNKDGYMERIKELKPISKNERKINTDLITETRKKAIALLKLKRDNIVATQYDSEELEIIEKEIEETKLLIKEKDRFIIRAKSKLEKDEKVKKRNPYLSKYFKRDDDPEL